MSLRKTLSVRLTEEQSELVEVLRTEKKLSSYISLLLGALLQDRVSTTQYLLGLSDQSVAYNDLQKSTIQANLYEKWLSLSLDIPFADWVSTLRSAEIKHFGGLDLPLVDVKSVLMDLLDDLGLEIVEKGSQTTDLSEQREGSSLEDVVNTSQGDLTSLVSKIVEDILSTKMQEEGTIQPLSEAPTEPLKAVETIGSNITPQKEIEVLDGNSERSEGVGVKSLETEGVKSELEPEVVETVETVEPTDSVSSLVSSEPIKDTEPSTDIDVSAVLSGFGLV